jgi:zinc finger protein
VTDPTDMSRDVLKSETCSIAIPELEFEMGGHALGGRFTTLEGLMNNVLESIEQNSVWGGGDGVAPDINERMTKFKLKFQDCVKANMNFTVVLDDPAGNSYMQNVYAPEEDPELTIESYERSFDQNEDLGLNDMVVEGYEES